MPRIGTGKMDQELSTLTILPENLDDSQHPYGSSQWSFTSSFKESESSSGLYGTRHTSGTQSNMQENTQTHKSLILK